jgi:DNA-binding NtrC family response regulator
MASGRHGGVRLVQVTGPPRRLEQLTMETELMRQGYTIVWPGRSATPVVRSATLHQHTVLMCFGEACVEDSLLWIHLLSEASPRRHIAVVVGTGRVAAGGWNEYSAAGTIWADTAIGRGRFQLARDRLHSLATEAALRKAPVPDSLRNCAGELAFWFGDRDAPDFGVRQEPGSIELGWRACSLWGKGHVAACAAMRARLECRARTGDPAARFWTTLINGLEPRGEDGPHRLAEIEEWVDRTGVPCRSRALARVICARGWKLRGNGLRCRQLVAGIGGINVRSPEALVARGLITQSRTHLPGVETLVNDRSHMPTATELTTILRQFENAPDEAAALAGGCSWLQAQGDDIAVGIVCADGQRLVAACGWKAADLAGEITAIRTGSRDGCAVPIRYGGAHLGSVVARCGEVDRDRIRRSAETLAVVCGSALRSRLEAIALRDQQRDCAPEIIGRSPAIADIRAAVARAAATVFPVLIEGESGTGKELVARALHRLSPRRDRRFVAVNCAALTDDLVEAELFGHTRGAFTGAVGARTGLFEEASGGTLFLDEVSELSPRAQAKLLRVLQEHEIRRLGENAPRRVDVRVVAATNLALSEAVASGRFRDDLRFRLAVVRLRLPALRDRLEDLPLLTHVFWRKAMAETGKRAALGADALAGLGRHTWPGNIRELQNVISGLAVAAPVHGRVTRRHAAHVLGELSQPDHVAIVPLEAARIAFERRLVAAALARHAGRRCAAAHDLGLTRQGLAKALRRLGLAGDEHAAGVA